MKKLSKLLIFAALYMTSQMSFAETIQCKLVFSMRPSQPPEYMIFTNQIKEALTELTQLFAGNYNHLNSSVSNRHNNETVHTIVELNNHTLDMLEAVMGSQELFNTGAKRILQRELKADIEKVFAAQGISQQAVNSFLQARMAFNKKTAIDPKKKNPIGFQWTAANDIESKNTKRTIGFHQTEIQENLYGRESADSKPFEPSQKKPIGFVTTQSIATGSASMNSIGFHQASEKTDVGFQLAMDFDFDHAIFIAISNQRPIGFTH